MRPLVLALAAVLGACAPSPLPAPSPRPRPVQISARSPQQVMSEIRAIEEAEGWSEATCARLVPAVEALVDDQGGRFPEMGLVLLRCGRRDGMALLAREPAGRRWARFLRPTDELRREVEELQRLALEPPMLPYSFVRMAQVHRDLFARTGRAEHAEEATKNALRALALDLGYGPAWAELALDHLAHADLEEEIGGPLELDHGQRRRVALAASTAREGLGHAPGYVPLHLVLARVLVLQGAVGEAREALTRAHELDVGNAWPLVAMGQLGLTTGDFEAASGAFGAALAVAPDCHEAHLGLAAVLRAQRRFDEATTHLERARRLAPDDPRGHYEAGLLAVARRDPAARDHFARFLALVPTGAAADNARALSQSGVSP